MLCPLPVPQVQIMGLTGRVRAEGCNLWQSICSHPGCPEALLRARQQSTAIQSFSCQQIARYIGSSAFSIKFISPCAIHYATFKEEPWMVQKADFANESGSNCRVDVWSSWGTSSAYLGRVGQGGYPVSMAGLGPWLEQFVTNFRGKQLYFFIS